MNTMKKKMYKKNVKVVKIRICVKMVVIKALAAVELNSYIAILTPPKHKKPPSSSRAKFFLALLLQCTSIYGRVL